jgi:glycolate oxidase
MKHQNTLHNSLKNIMGAEWIKSHQTYITVKPKTSEEISQVMKLANEIKIPVVPRGGATGWWSSTRPGDGGITIDMNRMEEVIEIDEDAMTVRMEAGITFSKLESALSPKGYRIVLFPESGKRATMGGHIQTWGTSPYSSSIFDDQATQIVGLKVVLPTGEIVPTGAGAVTSASGSFGRRFFPSDLTGLFIGAEGALGIITEAVLKIHGLPETIMTRMIGFRDLKSAMAVLRKVQDSQRGEGLSTIIEQRFMPKESLITVIPRLEKQLPESSPNFLAIRADGDASDVKRHMAQVCEIAENQGGQVVDDDVPEWWEGHLGLFEAAVIGKQPRVMLVAMVPFGKVLKASELTETFGKEIGMKITTVGYPFEGIVLFHAIIRCKDSTTEAREEALALARKLMEALMDLGCVPHRIGTDFLPVLLPKLNPAYFELVKRIKDVLDPNRIMHPGVILSDER